MAALLYRKAEMGLFNSVPHVSLANRTHLPELKRLYEEGFSTPAETEAPEPEARPTQADVESWLRGGFEVYQAHLQGRLAGAVRCSFPISACDIDQLVVAPGERRRGIGRHMMEHALGRAQRAGVIHVWTEVRPGLAAALQLFLDLGFRETTRIPAPPWRQELILLEMYI